MPAYPKDYLKNYHAQGCPTCGGSGDEAHGGQCAEGAGRGELPLTTAPHTDLSTRQVHLTPDDQLAY